MGLFDPIIKPIEFIVEAVKFIICLIAYIGNIFTWTGKAIAIGIKVLLAMPFCVFFYILHAVWEFFLFVIFDILLIIIFWPSRALAKALDYPIKIPTNKRQLKRIKSGWQGHKLYKDYFPEVSKKCYSFGKFPTFPEWNLKVPKYKG